MEKEAIISQPFDADADINTIAPPVGEETETELTLENLNERLERLEALAFPETRPQPRQKAIAKKLVAFANYLDSQEEYTAADRVTKVIEKFRTSK